jgi:hypothetical protein
MDLYEQYYLWGCGQVVFIIVRLSIEYPCGDFVLVSFTAAHKNKKEERSTSSDEHRGDDDVKYYHARTKTPPMFCVAKRVIKKNAHVNDSQLDNR